MKRERDPWAPGGEASGVSQLGMGVLRSAEGPGCYPTSNGGQWNGVAQFESP